MTPSAPTLQRLMRLLSSQCDGSSPPKPRIRRLTVARPCSCYTGMPRMHGSQRELGPRAGPRPKRTARPSARQGAMRAQKESREKRKGLLRRRPQYVMCLVRVREHECVLATAEHITSAHRHRPAHRDQGLASMHHEGASTCPCCSILLGHADPWPHGSAAPAEVEALPPPPPRPSQAPPVTPESGEKQGVSSRGPCRRAFGGSRTLPCAMAEAALVCRAGSSRVGRRGGLHGIAPWPSVLGLAAQAIFAGISSARLKIPRLPASAPTTRRIVMRTIGLPAYGRGPIQDVIYHSCPCHLGMELVQGPVPVPPELWRPAYDKRMVQSHQGSVWPFASATHLGLHVGMPRCCRALVICRTRVTRPFVCEEPTPTCPPPPPSPILKSTSTATRPGESEASLSVLSQASGCR